LSLGKATEKDLQSLVELNVRLKRLNEEFDPTAQGQGGHS
jgi:hypothetical protein